MAAQEKYEQGVGSCGSSCNFSCGSKRSTRTKFLARLGLNYLSLGPWGKGKHWVLVSALQHSPAWGWEQRWANDDISPEYLAIGEGRAVCVDGQRHCEFLSR